MYMCVCVCLYKKMEWEYNQSIYGTMSQYKKRVQKDLEQVYRKSKVPIGPLQLTLIIKLILNNRKLTLVREREIERTFQNPRNKSHKVLEILHETTLRRK